MHRILERQLRKHLGSAEALPERCRALFGAIDETYRHFDEDKILSDRSLDISSKELTAANAMLSATLDSTADGIVVTDDDGRIVLYNSRLLEIGRIPKEIHVRDAESLRKHIETLVEDQAAYFKRADDIRRSREPSSDMVRFRDGRIIEQYSRRREIAGKLPVRVWSFRDVTERVISEDLLRERAEELEKMNALMVGRELKMADMKEELERLRQTAVDDPQMPRV